MRTVEVKVTIEDKISLLKFEFEEENEIKTFFECKDKVFSKNDFLNLYVLLGQCEKDRILTRTMGAWIKTLSLVNQEQ